MNCGLNSGTAGSRARKGMRGFKRIELIVVVVVVLLLAAVGVFGGAQLRERARRAQCRSNLIQNCRAVRLYATDHKNLLPDCTRNNPAFFGTNFPWDMNMNLVNDLENREVNRNILYCPSNAGMNNEGNWDFGATRGNLNRVLGYAFLLKGNVPATPAAWHTNILGDGGDPAKTELVLDAVISESGHFTKIEANQTRRTSHLVPFSSKPAGGNIAFEDGHVEWRDFSKMQKRFFARGLNRITREPMVVDWYY